VECKGKGGKMGKNTSCARGAALIPCVEMKPLDATLRALESRKREMKNGQPYWKGREIHEIMGYPDWAKFERVIERAEIACSNTGVEVENHFSRTSKKVAVGSGAMVKKGDYFFSRYACYLIAMNADSSKPEIATAQTYFAVQTRRQEINDQLALDQERILLRDRLSEATKDLNSAAKHSGVQSYGLFHDAGYRGLYNMRLDRVKARKKLLPTDDIFDRAGRSELAANFFRATQTEERLRRNPVATESAAKVIHFVVGRQIRNTIRKNGNVMPEDMQPEPDIKTIRQKFRAPRHSVDEKKPSALK